MLRRSNRSILISCALIGFALVAAGCGSDNPASPIAAFQPEVVNNQDAFSFQFTDGTNVTTTLFYRWDNTGTAATVDHSTVGTAGTASVTLFDADSTQVYSSPLLASGNEATTTGTAGLWTIKVVFSDFDGTCNFNAQKL